MWWLIGIGGLVLFGYLIYWWCKRKRINKYIPKESAKNNLKPRMHTHDHGGFFSERNQNR